MTILAILATCRHIYQWAALHPLLCRILDNLPIAMVKTRQDEASGQPTKAYDRGYPVGFKATLEVRSRDCNTSDHVSCRMHAGKICQQCIVA